MKRFLLFIYILLSAGSYSFSQNRDAHWVFGDSVGINFNTNPPTVDTSRIIMTEEAAASISDVAGNLLFYVGSKDVNQFGPGFNTFVVRNTLDSIMIGGDSLAGNGTATQAVIIINDPSDSMKYYIFHLGAQVLYYSIVDMSLNGGLGAVISSNNSISGPASEKLCAVKAANDIDWMLITYRVIPITKYIVYKIDSVGITVAWQGINSCTTCQGQGQLIGSAEGDKLISAGGSDYTYLYQFDRCTGEISSPMILDYSGGYTYGCSFSPSGRFVYLSTFDSLWQFDTQASNVMASK